MSLFLGKERNFQKYDKQDLDDLDINYDTSSIMHFSRRSFSKNGKDTIIPIIPDASADVIIGQRDGLSPADVIKLNLLYDCQSKKFFTKELYTQPLFTCLKSTMKNQSNVWNSLKTNNKDTKTTPFLSLLCLNSNFEQISHIALP